MDQLSLYHFMDELSAQRLEDYKLRFEQLKRNKQGVITLVELGIMIRSMGENPSDKELEEIFKASDLDNNGEIDFKEYCYVMAQYEDGEEFCDIFKMFDQDGDGYINEEDLLYMLENTDMKGERKAIKRLIKSVDRDGDGRIGCEEFMAEIKRALA